MVCPKPKAVLGIQFSYWKTNCFGPQTKPFGRGILTFMFFMFFFLGIRINRHWLIDIIINNIFFVSPSSVSSSIFFRTGSLGFQDGYLYGRWGGNVRLWWSKKQKLRNKGSKETTWSEMEPGLPKLTQLSSHRHIAIQHRQASNLRCRPALDTGISDTSAVSM